MQYLSFSRFPEFSFLGEIKKTSRHLALRLCHSPDADLVSAHSLVLHHLVHFELRPNRISKTFALAKTWRRAYWALTSVDNGICTALLAWKLGRAAWCTTLDPQSNHRAERIFRTLRFAFYITIISGLVPTCLAVAIAVQACNKQDQGFGHFLIRTLIFLYSWINLLATQIAYLTTIIKSHELLREDTTVRRAPDMDVIRDLQNPAVLSSVEERSTKTRPAHQLLSGFLHERKHSRDIHHLTVVQEQQETRKTSSEEGRRNHNRTQLSKLKSLLENLGLTHALPRNVDDMSSSKPRSRRLNDHQVHTEPSRTHLVVGRSESEQRGQPGVVATIGCPMDLEPRPDYWSDTGEIPAADEQRPPACQPPTCKSSLHCEDNDTIDVELPKPRETKGKLTPEKTAFPLNVNVANQKIFCMPLVTDYSYPPIHNNKDMLAPSPAHAHAGSSSLTRRYSASVATTPSYAPSTQVGSSLSLAKP